MVLNLHINHLAGNALAVDSQEVFATQLYLDAFLVVYGTQQEQRLFYVVDGIEDVGSIGTHDVIAVVVDVVALQVVA